MIRILSIFCICIFITGCLQEENTSSKNFPDIGEIPHGFPPIAYPSDNAFTKDRWELGRKLFYDPILSIDNTISCASCHKPEIAFSDNLPVSEGVFSRKGVRNSPSLANIAYHPYLMREGGVATLEMQVLVPVQEHQEMGFSLPGAAIRMKNDSAYVRLTNKAYQRNPDPYTITRALAVFERTLISGNSFYDNYVINPESKLLDDAQKRGLELFFSKRTDCSSCHGGFNFTDYRFANNGLYEDYSDEGRMRLTGKEEDRAVFKVPSLRNVALSAPYMHDGSIKTLKDVIAHYNEGGKNHINKSHLIRPLGLSHQEKNDLVRFLESLTDNTFIQNPAFR